MTRQGWRECVLKAVTEHHGGDSTALDLLSRLLEEQDNAKGVLLRAKGYGCIGMPWADVCAEIPETSRSRG